MPIRTKTLQYWLGQWTGSVASSSTYIHPTETTIFIAETGSRIFRNVFAEIFWRDITAAITNRGSVATQSLFLKLGNNNYTTASIVSQLTDTAEHVSYIGSVDLTEYFSSSFGNNISQSCNWQYNYRIEQPSTQSYNIRGLATSLYITYTYNDDNTSIRSKTAVIPLSYTGSMIQHRGRQLDVIPILNTYCTESNKTFDQIWMEMEGANGHTAATNYTMSFYLNSEPHTSSFEIQNPTNVGTWTKYYFPLSHIDTSRTHSFHAGISATAVTHESDVLTLKATYRYNHDNSNYILNTPEYILDNSNQLNVQFSSDNELLTSTYGTINIQEPEPLIQKNCAVKIYSSLNAGTTLKIFPKLGISHSWLMPAGASEGSTQIGQFRIDPNKASPFTGSTALINRGDNYFSFDYSTTTANRIGSIVTTVLLNYISGKDPRGDGVHSHTITSLAVTGSNNLLTVIDGTANSQYGKSLLLDCPIYDPDYYISSHMIESIANAPAGTLSIINQWWSAIDNVGDGSIYPSGSCQEVILMMEGDNENGVLKMPFNYNNYFTKHPRSIYRKNELQNTVPRYYRDSAWRNSPRQVTTYHGISYTVTGSISGYTGNGSGIFVECVESGSRVDNVGKVFQTITNIGGVFSGSVYDNTKKYYVTARQSSTLTSRSDDATGSIIV